MINHSLSKTIIHTPLAIVGAGTAGIALSSRLIADTLL